jgi:hypothetical protein
VTDDTAALQSIFNKYAGTQNIIYINAGSYIITDTVKIPPGAKIVGELWAQLVASVRSNIFYPELPKLHAYIDKGSKFSDDASPRPMLQVGQKGQKGSVELQDLLFTTVGATAGLVSVEWNLEADQPGSAAMWDCHARIGGATGSKLTSDECPALTSGYVSTCKAGSMIVHLTSEASAYFENVWVRVIS